MKNEYRHQNVVMSTGNMQYSIQKKNQRKKENGAQYFIDEIQRLKGELKKWERESNLNPHKKHNIGFWNGCITQMEATAYDVLSSEDYRKVMDYEYQ